MLILLPLLLLMLLVLLAGCEKPRPVTAETALEPVPWSRLDDPLPGDGLTEWAAALEASAGYYRRVPPERPFRFGPHTVPATALAAGCAELAALARSGDREALLARLKGGYQLYRAAGGDDGGMLVTAYYEPLLHGARQPDERFRYPLYRRPADLLEADLGAWSEEWKGRKLVARLVNGRLQPYPDRQAIDQQGALQGQGLELAWVDDPVALFFLHIQGSGRVQLSDGQQLRVGYHGANGHPYRSIGALLIDEGEIPREEMSLPALRAWLRHNPEERERVLFSNPSYVFFRPLEGPAVGNIQVPLTGGHSIATDHRLFPKGAPALLFTEAPRYAGESGHQVAAWRPEARWVVNQDTGGAIRGSGRVDLFLGFGPEAERRAGLMKQPGTLFFIAPAGK